MLLLCFSTLISLCYFLIFLSPLFFSIADERGGSQVSNGGTQGAEKYSGLYCLQARQDCLPQRALDAHRAQLRETHGGKKKGNSVRVGFYILRSTFFLSWLRRGPIWSLHLRVASILTWTNLFSHTYHFHHHCFCSCKSALRARWSLPTKNLRIWIDRPSLKWKIKPNCGIELTIWWKTN